MIEPISEVLWQCSEHGKSTIGHTPCPDCEKEEKMTNENIYTEPACIKALDLQSRHEEYLTLCTNGDVNPMPYDVWLEWDEHVYQKHVREAANPLSPATFQRMQEPESNMPCTITQTVTANNRAHEEAQANVLTMQQVIDNYESQKADLWKLIEEARESARTQKAQQEEKINNIRRQLHKLTEENKDISKQLAMADEQLRNSGGWVVAHKYQEQLHDSEAKVTALTTEVDRLTVERDRAIHFKDEADKEVNKVFQEVLHTRESLSAANKKIEELYSNNIHDTFIRECADMKQRIKILREENVHLDKENEQLSIDLDKLREGLEEPIDPACDLRKMIELFNKCGEAGITVEQAIDKASREVLDIPANQPLYPHYFREVPRNTTHVDISWVLRAWDVPCCEGHAIKKLMASGKRGAKDRVQDLKEARDSINRAIELENTK